MPESLLTLGAIVIGAVSLAEAAGPAAAVARADWPRVGNDPGGMRYSELTQINRDNVRNLKVAWVYRTRDASEKSTIECTPIVIDGVMYLTTVRTRIVALDAVTGRERWQFDPYS